MNNNTYNGKEKKLSGKLKTVIIILAVLLSVAAIGLAARLIYINVTSETEATAVIPDNTIGSQPEQTVSNSSSTVEDSSTAVDSSTSVSSQETSSKETSSKPVKNALELSLYKGKPDDNEKFTSSNMLPGDREKKYFCVRLNHSSSVDLYFNTEVTEQTKKLGDVLHIKVTCLADDSVLYDGSFNGAQGKEFGKRIEKNDNSLTDIYYEVEVSLDTSVGNEYQAAKVLADFNWYVKDEGALAPPTGDSSNPVLWIVLGLASLTIFVILIIALRRKKEADDIA